MAIPESPFERHAVHTGFLLVLAGIGLAIANGTLSGPAWFVGTAAVAAFGLCALSRGLRLYRTGVTAPLPASVGRVGIRVRPRVGVTAATVLFALALPAAAAVAVVALTDWGWLAVAAGMLFGCPGLVWGASRYDREEELRYLRESPEAEALLARLCMRADMPAPELVIEPSGEANAWTTRGRIHVTTQLLRTLDPPELEAVLAHELAHLARRDAAVMDVCSAPSRALLSFAGNVTTAARVWLQGFAELNLGWAVSGVIVAAVCIPPAFILGWLFRLSLLGMSRSREFSADAAAAVLTGRPSALASALVKLDDEQDWLPQADLRQAQARAVICIVEPGSPRLGRLFSSHPRTATRVRRLQALEERVQAGGRAIRLED